jgi:aminoglycoside phosphotransferase (APT) family kinase protein
MNKEIIIDATLVRHLVDTQFPQWKDLPIRPVAHSGWDNRTFHLGEQMLVRMPSAEDYALQVEKEQRWLPKLAPLLPLPIPAPLGLGQPANGYPWKWSIYTWLPGETATPSRILNLSDFATSLAQFLVALEQIDAANGPLPGPHSFYRGGALTTYNAETRQAIAALKGKIDVVAATEIWEKALATTWHNSPVWVHGDISTGNLLLQEDRLSAVIDFGQLTIGDPACDLAIAWTLFKDTSRDVFRSTLSLDSATWARGRGWALWKALIVYAQLPGTNHLEIENSKRILDEIIRDYKQENLG